MCEISVIVPAYNVGDYLAECLDSLLAQSFADFEAIVVDDGSTDATAAIVERYAAADARVRCIHQQNTGVSAARNRALEEARGRYVCFLDGDDLYTPHALETLHRRAVETDADLVIGDYEIFDSLHAWGVQSMRTLLKRATYERFDQNLLLCYVVWNKLFRRSIIAEHRLVFPPISFAEDSVFSMSFAYRSSTIVTVDEVICRYRRRGYASELSATQVITMRSETDHLAAHAGVRHEAIAHLGEWVEEAPEPAERTRREAAMVSYLDGLLGKEVANLIDLRYRTFWNAEEGVAALIADRVAEARTDMSYKTWSDLCRSVRDLPLALLPRSRAEVAAFPLISVAVYAEPENAAELEDTLHSLYIQSFPRFEVFVPREVLTQLPQKYARFENIHAVDESSEADFYNRSLAESQSDYLLFTRAGFVYRSTALLRMYSAFRNSNTDLVTFPVSRVSDVELPAVYPTQRLAFETFPKARDYASDLNHRYDCLLGNKIVRRAYLSTLSFAFTGSSTSDAETLLSTACFIKSAHRVVHTPLDPDTFTRRFVGGRRPGLGDKAALWAARNLPPTRRQREVLLLDTRGLGFSQSLLSLRDALLAEGLRPRYLFTSLDDDETSDVETRALVKRSVVAAGAVVCASDSIPVQVPLTRPSQRRLLLQAPRLNTVVGYANGMHGTGERYTDIVVQSRAFEAGVRGSTCAVGLPATDVMHDSARRAVALRRLQGLRPDSKGKPVLLLASHLPAAKALAGVDVAPLAYALAEAGYFVVAAIPGLAAHLAHAPAALSDVLFDAAGCFLGFDQLLMGDVVVTTRFADAVFRSAGGGPMVFWSPQATDVPEAVDLPAALRQMAVTDLSRLPEVLDARPWESAVDAFAQTFVKPNVAGSSQRIVRTLLS